MILTLRTDNPLAEVGIYDNDRQITYSKWQAHRELSDTIHAEIKKLLNESGINWADISGIVYYKGPGSFTGLRIGAAVSNALASTNGISVSSQNGENWIEKGIIDLAVTQSRSAIPEYGSEPHITAPRK